MNIAQFSQGLTAVKGFKNTQYQSGKKKNPFQHTTVSSMKLSFSEEVKRAMRSDEFTLYYQPQVNVNTGELCGAEALIRWEHPDRGLLYPDSFIPQAEYSGQIIDIERWTLHHLFKQQAQWQKKGNQLTNIALNISGNHFVQGSLVTEVAHLAHSYSINPADITIELTERIATDLEVWVSQTSMLKDIGVRVSIDDFGTGYNTLAHLMEVSVDFLKIDRSFIMKMAPYNNAFKIVQSLVTMAEKMGAVPIAEGVDSNELLRLFIQAGGKVIQGHHYSKAIPAEEFSIKYLSPKR